MGSGSLRQSRLCVVELCKVRCVPLRSCKAVMVCCVLFSSVKFSYGLAVGMAVEVSCVKLRCVMLRCGAVR